MRHNYLLQHGIKQHAEINPANVAVSFQKETQTYRQLIEKTNQLAHTLISLGVKRGDRIGIYMYKEINTAAAIYGILTAGAVYVPLDPFAPDARSQYVIQNCDIKVIISQEKKLKSLQAVIENTPVHSIVGIPASSIESVNNVSWDVVEQAPKSIPEINLTENDMAYILYTSGSTGVPKGIVHTHRSGLSFAQWAADTYKLSGNDRLSNHAPLHFDLSTFDFFAAAQVGAATVILPEVLTKFPANLSKWIQDEKITVWYSVPFALIQMLQRGNLEEKDFSALRWIIFAGEPFPTKHLRDLMNLLPGIGFSNLYGPTETNVCTYYHVLPISPGDNEPISIGIACENVEDLVVDEYGAPLPDGETGELLIRGPIVMRGYWGRPDLTENGFYRRKISEHFADIFYRTGDLVQKMEDGNYKFFGRKDRQIKTRGYRVELDEIEAVLLSHEKIQEAAVYAVPDGDGSNLIEAAVIARDGNGLASDELFNLLNQHLPSYAIPQTIEVTSDFPRTSTGKINRKELQKAALEKREK